MLDSKKVMKPWKFPGEKSLHLVFEISLWIKGIFALAEFGGGIAALFVGHETLVSIAVVVTQGELAEDPRDPIANFLLYSAQHLSVSTQFFTAAYLLSHGLIKLWVVAGLLREKLWYYPVAFAVFGLFIVYQLYRFNDTHSGWLLLITAVDVIVIGLAWHEYRYLKTRVSRPGFPSDESSAPRGPIRG